MLVAGVSNLEDSKENEGIRIFVPNKKDNEIVLQANVVVVIIVIIVLVALAVAASWFNAGSTASTAVRTTITATTTFPPVGTTGGTYTYNVTITGGTITALRSEINGWAQIGNGSTTTTGWTATTATGVATGTSGISKGSARASGAGVTAADVTYTAGTGDTSFVMDNLHIDYAYTWWRWTYSGTGTTTISVETPNSSPF